MRDLGVRKNTTRRTLCAAAAGVLLLGLPARGRGDCVGDCDGGGDVNVTKLITMVNIALGTAPVSSCMAGDPDHDGIIAVTEIIIAVNNTLYGCPTPTPTPTATITPTETPALGPLGIKHFVLTRAKSTFSVVGILAGTDPIQLGTFQGQINGQVGQPAYLDLDVGAPDSGGVAKVNVVGAPDYIYVNAPLASLVLCIKPVLPAMNAGLLQCDGGLDFSIALNVDHRLGVIGVNGFTPEQCTNQDGTVESPNQICAAGALGFPCRTNGDCDSTTGMGDGLCGLAPAVCSQPESNQTACRADADCDSSPGALDGVCGTPGAHPGVCNGSFTAGQAGGDSGPGAMVLAPVPGQGVDLNGLPVVLTTEKALPCGDEGTPPVTDFALTTGIARSTIFNFSNQPDSCTTGKFGETCATDADCDTAPGMGDGLCGKLTYEIQGQNFSCQNWSTTNGPGCLVLTAPQLDSNQTGDGDIITAFKFCSQ